MRLSRNQIIFASLLILLIVVGIGVGLALTRQTQNPDVEATRGSANQPFATVPPFSKDLTGGKLPSAPPPPLKGDCTGDGKVTKADQSCFMQHYLAKDSEGDMDGSGQVNSLDLTIFRNLISQ